MWRAAFVCVGLSSYILVVGPPLLVWTWAVVEGLNGIGHPLWSLWQRAYQPGTATAPLMLALALSLMYQLRLRPTAGAP